ncbi:MAG TPA: SusD/RagB family nutrient-binding outer membrane lipoprotein [Cyclobacteriaceae bacterium]|nr:SusD/RagB family nutrient-binding outer membrane lipoprotein [Cyclobacteriaceae bacterium]HMV09918.1 SusD/RagB family nutrient-binding outer membrane lipoprotein [Cyclobacteriaceae bacterium]HMV88868.1 SusD/RagB family nutrient-binding outer membrane lipoprotein [Cyclobacteriaceae bacterium]HMW99656.1 SusD/RagB family nutrient-binding outer membrane lipoprotein [Cyclobacteriaceae bacterium]HMX50967.1 SusD/RagB family nutrient-binding outer membrane lipoprotein [Cyclobacteriaceae bacterium]
MKTTKKIIYRALSGLIALSFSACSDFLDINHDPNATTDAPVDLILPAATLSTASVVGGQYAVLGAMWSQHWTQSNSANQYKNIDGFNLASSDLNFQFSELYMGALNDFEYIRNQSKAQKNWSLYLIATVQQAYTWQVLADLYDELPFREALQGDANRAPHYDPGSLVYDSLVNRIDYALTRDFNEVEAGARTSKNPGGSDYIFGDALGAGEDLDELIDTNIENWIRFANTLKLKLFLRQIKARPTEADAGLQAMYDAGAEFLQTDADIVQFEDETNKSNPLYEVEQRNLGGINLKASRTLLSYLQSIGDTRIPRLFVAGSGGQKGLDQGNFEVPTTIVPAASLSKPAISATDPVYLISKAESYFLQAEAALRGYGTGNPEALFDLGVSASFQQLGLVPKNYDLPGTSFEADLEQIIVQKWIALAGTHENLEAFFEMNRTNYPVKSAVYSGLDNGNQNPAYVPGQIVYPKEGVTAGLFAKRLLFPDTERRRNANTPDQVPITEEVWWDVD